MIEIKNLRMASITFFFLDNNINYQPSHIRGDYNLLFLSFYFGNDVNFFIYSKNLSKKKNQMIEIDCKKEFSQNKKQNKRGL